MNESRRTHLKDALEIITNAHDEESEALGNMPESLQYSERGEAMNDACDRMQEAVEALEEIVG